MTRGQRPLSPLRKMRPRERPQPRARRRAVAMCGRVQCMEQVKPASPDTCSGSYAWFLSPGLFPQLCMHQNGIVCSLGRR